MQYTLDIGAWNAVFAVPCALVDRHIKLAGKEQLQVILWVLRNPGRPFSAQEAGTALGMTPEQAEEALEYWVQRGLLAQQGSALAPVPQEELPQNKTAQESEPAAAATPCPNAPSDKPAPPRRFLKPDAHYLAARLKESATLRQLLQEAELVLGILSPAMTNVILAGCDDYGLPPEVLIMLLQYVKSVGKTSTAYVESVVRDWSASGVNTLAAAEEKLRLLDEKRLAWGRVAAAAGLAKRSPSKKEEEAAYRWVNEWHFSQEMIAAAYERCVDNTGKFSAAYIDRVLGRWQRDGLQTPEDVERAEVPGAHTGPEKSYRTEDMETISFFDLPEGM